jgi:hypothetical protein
MKCIKLFEGNLKEISQFFEGKFRQNKEKKRIFRFLKVEALIMPPRHASQQLCGTKLMAIMPPVHISQQRP